MKPTVRIGRGRRRKPLADINVVPYIDVSLVLLVIFMVTSPLLLTGVNVNLPQAESKTIELGQEPPVIVTLKADGECLLDVGNQQNQPVNANELSQAVLATLSDKSGRPVLIRGDRAVEYGRVVTVMAALKRAGVPSVGLMTQPEN